MRVQRSYLVRERQVIDVERPANWDEMSLGDRDQYVCDVGTLIDEFTEHVDERDLDLIEVRPKGTAATQFALDQVEYSRLEYGE